MELVKNKEHYIFQKHELEFICMESIIALLQKPDLPFKTFHFLNLQHERKKNENSRLIFFLTKIEIQRTHFTNSLIYYPNIEIKTYGLCKKDFPLKIGPFCLNKYIDKQKIEKDELKNLKIISKNYEKIKIIYCFLRKGKKLIFF
jgi:hypothetical protein